MANYEFRMEVRNDQNDGWDIYFPLTIADNIYMDEEMTKTISAKLIEMIDSLTTHKSSADHDNRYYDKQTADGKFLGKTGTASSASKLSSARTITFKGDTSGSVSFDGSKNVSVTLAVANDSHSHDTRYYTKTQSNDRYYTKTQSNDRYYTQTQSNDRFLNESSNLSDLPNKTTARSNLGLGNMAQKTVYTQSSTPSYKAGAIWIKL